MEPHAFLSDRVTIRKRGQVTIPKKIRDLDHIEENDTLIVTRTPNGDIVLRKQRTKTPEDQMLEAIRQMPKFDWRKAWEEVKAERARER